MSQGLPRDRARVPRRFRRRLLLLLLACSLAPLLAWGLFSGSAVRRALSLSLEPLDPLLERSQQAARAGAPGDPALWSELQRARLRLAQAELLRRSLAERLPLWLLGAVLLSATLAGAAALLFGARLSSPLEQLASGMERVAQGDLTVPLAERPGPADDELELLVRQFNRMSTELLLQRERLRTSENLAAWREVAQRLAHELRNPLTGMRLGLARVGRALAAEGQPPDPARLAESTGLLGDEVERLLRLTDSFAQFARLPAPQLAAVELAALLRDSCALYAEVGPVPVRCQAVEARCLGDGEQLRRLFGNLIKNGLEATPPGGEALEVELSLHGGRACIEVRDRGTAAVVPRSGAELLRSLGTTKQGGSGLGLPIAQKIAHDHGGSISLAPREGGGAVARVELPLRTPELEA